MVGNPANTNCMIAQRNAPSIPAANFTCLTRLDMNRAKAQASFYSRATKTIPGLLIRVSSQQTWLATPNIFTSNFDRRQGYLAKMPSKYIF